MILRGAVEVGMNYMKGRVYYNSEFQFICTHSECVGGTHGECVGGTHGECVGGTHCEQIEYNLHT